MTTTRNTRTVIVTFTDTMAKREIWSLAVTTVPAKLTREQGNCYALQRAYDYQTATGGSSLVLCASYVRHSFA